HSFPPGRRACLCYLLPLCSATLRCPAGDREGQVGPGGAAQVEAALRHVVQQEDRVGPVRRGASRAARASRRTATGGGGLLFAHPSAHSSVTNGVSRGTQVLRGLANS